ncbi:MAG: permease-like cell division protein FtsX [Marinifilaceae bacterium]|jgi:cell division transport system permease protein|nr:permease-like cell division protein FtsX [Marinifilaceae bacterium]
MKSQSNKRRKLRTSYITLIVSISMVLFLLGSIGLLILNANHLSKYVKENIGFSISLKSNTREIDILKLQKQLDASDFVKSTSFVDKETAAESLQKELGEDFIHFLGSNPLKPTIDIKLYAEYTNNDSIAIIQQNLMANKHIAEIRYQKSVINFVNSNVRKISYFILILSAIFFLISFTLIHNIMRLSIYSQRFIIYTMQLVGATRSFIRLPFVMKSVFYGIVGGLIANLGLSLTIYFITDKQKGLISFEHLGLLIGLYLVVMGIGAFITWFSSYFAVNKYLQIDGKNLY